VALRQLARPITDGPVAAHVRLDLARGNGIFEAGRPASNEDVLGWGVVRMGVDPVARIRVSLDAAPTRSAARRVWIVSSLLGLALGLTLFFLPVATVRRADESNTELWDALSEAKGHLEDRVETRTRELRKRESQLRELGIRLLRVQEEERARISRDLHDELGQTLTGLRLRLAAVEARVGDDVAVQDQLAAAVEAVDEGVEEIRRLAHNLRPPALDELGLGDALRGLIDEWAQLSELVIELRVESQTPDGEAAEVLFRVAQEALTNVMRHAQASYVRLSADHRDGRWYLEVEDDGVGLSETGEVGLGLLGLRERLERAGGQLSVEVADAGGVRLVAWLPDSDLPGEG
jgi:signal transduction histidine kinase